MLPQVQRIPDIFGENIRLARLSRKLGSGQVAARAGMGRTTLVKIKQGHPGVGIGQYLNVLKVLGLEKNFLLLAKYDELGRSCKMPISINALLKEINRHEQEKHERRGLRVCILAYW